MTLCRRWLGNSPAATITAGLLLLFGQSAFAEIVGPRFCIVPVKDGAPTAADVDQAWRITDVAFRIPGLPSLVFTPMNRRGQWTIDADRRLVPYVGPFPHNFSTEANGSWSPGVQGS
jgi:hypothetical protein